MMSIAGGILGMYAGAQAQARKDYVEFLQNANAVDPQAAVSLSALSFSKCMKGFESEYPKALDHLLQKGKIVQIGEKYYLAKP